MWFHIVLEYYFSNYGYNYINYAFVGDLVLTWIYKILFIY